MAKKINRAGSGKEIKSNRTGWTKRTGSWVKVSEEQQGKSHKKPKEDKVTKK